MAEDSVKGRQSPDGSYELDLDDTISHLPEVLAEAVAAVHRNDDGTEEEETEMETKTEDVFAVPNFTVPDSPAAQAPETSDRKPREQEAEEPEAEERAEEPAAEEQAEEESEAEESERERELTAHNRELTARNERLEAEAGALRERLTRTLADFDNYRKRTEREQEKLRRYALYDVLGDFLGVIDNLERAMAASGSAEDLKQGVAMIVRQLDDLLRRYGVSPIESLGKPFDPTVHEAVAREEGTEVEEPTVTAELQKGYHLHDRLLRPAMVYVAMPVPQAEEAEETEEAEQAEGAEQAEEREDEELGEPIAEVGEPADEVVETEVAK